jgi:hypothetical protein
MPAGQILFASFALTYSFGILSQKKVYNPLAPKRQESLGQKKVTEWSRIARFG